MKPQPRKAQISKSKNPTASSRAIVQRRKKRIAQQAGLKGSDFDLKACLAKRAAKQRGKEAY